LFLNAHPNAVDLQASDQRTRRKAMHTRIDPSDVQSFMPKFLSEAGRSLAGYLERTLPPLYSDWWAKAVLNRLSFQQKRRVEGQGITSLASLDLAALLRVLDQNWYAISNSLNLTSEDRHFVKEMQTVRNRWAHVNNDSYLVDDVYRDLDTLQRFAMLVGVPPELLDEIYETKESLRGSSTSEGQAPSTEEETSTDFIPGHVVVLRSNPSVKGAVVSAIPGEPEDRYIVFIDGGTQTFYASQLKAEESSQSTPQFLPSGEFHSYLSSLQLQFPGLSTLYSLNAARIDFIPYQFRPVLRFIKSDRPRLLIADGVGVGKTIEAGLILRELQARSDVHSILIICPRPLVTERKWQNEMKRFDERFTHLDGKKLRYCIEETDLEGAWPDSHNRVIMPYSLFDETLLHGKSGRGRKQKGLLDLDPPPRFDLVIVDEAHHIRNPETFRHQAVRYFCDNAEAVVFLTATPVQLGSHDLFVLLNTIRPDLIIDKESFEHMAEPNPFINEAVNHARSQESGWEALVAESLNSAAETSWGRSILRHNPDFKRLVASTEAGGITQEERVQIITELEELHTFSGLINRTRRRDIGEFTIRKPETVTIEFTPSQQELHDELLNIQAEILSHLYGDTNVKFMMTTIRRQAASSIFGLVPFLHDILSRHLDELFWDEADNSSTPPGDRAISKIEDQINTVLSLAENLDPEDPKLDALKQIINDKQSLPNNKIMLFSSFRHTLNYLHTHLKADGFRVGLIHGDVPDDERLALRNRFEMDRDEEDCLDVLLFSEVGCEGLDYQFCDCMVNYDLPWNPMRVEQRIGRIDRNGQQSEHVDIFNLITPGTVDADIYDRCLIRIGVFENAIGGCEDILGEVTQEIKNIAEDIELTDEERQEKLQQLADNKIRLIQAQEDLEQKQLELFGIRLPNDKMRSEIDNASSFWLTPNSIQHLVSTYLKKAFGSEQEHILGDKCKKTLRLSQEARNTLLQDFQKLPRKKIPMYQEWATWLKGAEQHISITFESDCAIYNPGVAFLMPLHPLVKQAALATNVPTNVYTAVEVQSDIVPQGTYEFAIYKWQFYGLRDDLILQPVTQSETLSNNLTRLLANSSPANEQTNLSDFSLWEDLDGEHQRMWSEAKSKHERRIQELVEYRRESLTTSHRARIALIEEQLQQTDNAKIHKMRNSQLASAEADYARHIQELDIAIERADIVASPVAYGVVIVSNGEG